jgi:hypothetical protein
MCYFTGFPRWESSEITHSILDVARPRESSEITHSILDVARPRESSAIEITHSNQHSLLDFIVLAPWIDISLHS